LSDREIPVRPDSLRSVLGAAVLFALVLLAFASVKSHHDLVAARDHEGLLRTTIGLTEHRIERLHGRIRQLRNDPDTLERLAREELGLVKPGDMVLVLPEATAGAKPHVAGIAGIAGIADTAGIADIAGIGVGSLPPGFRPGTGIPAELLPASVPAAVPRGSGAALH
jgi:cell division protein FtsB